jgi:hypothetical protein
MRADCQVHFRAKWWCVVASFGVEAAIHFLTEHVLFTRLLEWHVTVSAFPQTVMEIAQNWPLPTLMVSLARKPLNCASCFRHSSALSFSTPACIPSAREMQGPLAQLHGSRSEAFRCRCRLVHSLASRARDLTTEADGPVLHARHAVHTNKFQCSVSLGRRQYGQ